MSQDIRELQERLNKVGGMLTTDGLMGPNTRRAIRQARELAGLPPGHEADAALRDWLAQRAEPSPELPTRGVTFIAREETGGIDFYEAHAAMPHWPGGASGVTIGVGYDLRFAAETFEDDWGSRLPDPTLSRLRPWLGKQGSAEAVRGLEDIRVPWPMAWEVFISRILPREVDKTKDTYTPFPQLPGLCRSALVSLVYNRGTDLTDSPGSDRRKEMRAIRDLLAGGKLDAVPQQFLSMRRLWPDSAGLRKRRQREAKLWEEGLQQVA